MLEKREDGSLDSRQRWFSGKFRSPMLEAAFSDYSYAVWQPRLLSVAVLLILVELFNFVTSYMCMCGLRFGVYMGGLLVFSYGYPIAMLMCAGLLFSPASKGIKKGNVQIILAVIIVGLMLGYYIPLMVHLRAQPLALLPNQVVGAPWPTNMTDPSQLLIKSTKAGMWYVVTIVLFLTVINTVFIGLGVGALQCAVQACVVIIANTAYMYVWFERTVGIVPSMSISLSGLSVYVLSIVVSSTHIFNSRRQFVIQLYIQHERDVRIEQLQREKERLDYERQFAVKAMESKRRDPSRPYVCEFDMCEFDRDAAHAADYIVRLAHVQWEGVEEGVEEGVGIGTGPSRRLDHVDGGRLTQRRTQQDGGQLTQDSGCDTFSNGQSSQYSSTFSEPELATMATAQKPSPEPLRVQAGGCSAHAHAQP